MFKMTAEERSLIFRMKQDDDCGGAPAEPIELNAFKDPEYPEMEELPGQMCFDDFLLD